MNIASKFNVCLRTPLLWVITQRTLVIFNRRFGTTCSLNTFFPSFHFVHVSVVMCLAVTRVRILSITERIFSATLTVTLPSIQPLARTILADTNVLRHFHCPCSSLYELPIGATGFLLDSWTPRMGPIGCPETSVINYQSSLRKYPEERSSQLFRGGRLKSLLMFIYYSIAYSRLSACRLNMYYHKLPMTKDKGRKWRNLEPSKGEVHPITDHEGPAEE